MAKAKKYIQMDCALICLQDSQLETTRHFWLGMSACLAVHLLFYLMT